MAIDRMARSDTKLGCCCDTGPHHKFRRLNVATNLVGIDECTMAGQFTCGRDVGWSPTSEMRLMECIWRVPIVGSHGQPIGLKKISCHRRAAFALAVGSPPARKGDCLRLEKAPPARLG